MTNRSTTAAVHGISVTIGDTELTFLGRRGVYWPKHNMLLVADTHFGKEATFRHHGIPVPRGSTHGTLSTISEMLIRTEAKRLMILGDLFHARSSITVDVRESVESFFAAHDDVEFSLVMGNHDVHVGKLPSAWPVKVFEPGWTIDGVAMGHHPGDPPEGAALLLCGHLHPAMRLQAGGEDVGKLPCFWLSKQCLVLPAIGEFTGTHVVRPTANDRAWVIEEGRVIPVKR